MEHNHSQQIMVAILDDLVQRTIPRIKTMRSKLEQGGVLSAPEVAFCLAMLQRLSHCHRIYGHDPQCVKIFSCMTHLMSELVKLAHDNESSKHNRAA